MTVSRDVVVDLLPLYLAGEASPDSARLVKAYLESDPSLAAEVRRMQASVPVERSRSVDPDLELVALRRARRTLAVRQWSFGLALFFTALSLSFEFHADGTGIRALRSLVVHYFATLWWLPACALASWAAYFRLRHRARL